jgi:hypothetical protein
VVERFNFSGSFNVGLVASVDPDHVTGLDEQGDLNLGAGLERRELCPS